MRIRRVLNACVALTVVGTAVSCGRPAQDATQGVNAGAAAASAQVHGELIQVMRGILFPASNVIFFAQATNPDEVKRAADPATATDPLEGSYGGWQAVENAGVAVAESANLLMIPGRQCSNGRPAPIENSDWLKFVQALRDAGMASVKAAQAKNNDAILEAADQVNTACGQCHEKWRDVVPMTNRCTN